MSPVYRARWIFDGNVFDGKLDENIIKELRDTHVLQRMNALYAGQDIFAVVGVMLIII